MAAMEQEETIDTTLTTRGGTHGDYTENANISQQLKEVIRSCRGYKRLPATHAEALDMIMHKVARIMAGNAEFYDHWHDIAGYATLAERECTYQKGDKLP